MTVWTNNCELYYYQRRSIDIRKLPADSETNAILEAKARQHTYVPVVYVLNSLSFGCSAAAPTDASLCRRGWTGGFALVEAGEGHAYVYIHRLS